MIFNINVNDVLNSVYGAINADNTLKSGDYLESANKVFINRNPAEVKAPYIIITLQSLKPNAMQYYTGELRIFCYTYLLSNSLIDERGNLILSRCEELLNNEILTITGMTVQPLFSLGVVPSFCDPQMDNEKARGLLRLKIELGHN